MSTLEIVGALALRYLSAGAALSLLGRSAAAEDDPLASVVYCFIHVMAWPLVLADAFVPAVRHILLDQDGPGDEDT